MQRGRNSLGGIVEERRGGGAATEVKMGGNAFPGERERESPQRE